jgi:hypothetical protein
MRQVFRFLLSHSFCFPATLLGIAGLLALFSLIATNGQRTGSALAASPLQEPKLPGRPLPIDATFDMTSIDTLVAGPFLFVSGVPEARDTKKARRLRPYTIVERHIGEGVFVVCAHSHHPVRTIEPGQTETNEIYNGYVELPPGKYNVQAGLLDADTGALLTTGSTSATIE